MKTLILCPPLHFDITYEINPWMNTQIQVNKNTVHQQYTSLKKMYESIGILFKEITPEAGLSDQVYTTDTGHAERNIFIKSNFRYPERRNESLLMAHFLEKKGYEIKTIPEGIYFEGQGDFVRNTNAYFLGHGKRSMKEAAPFLEKILKKQVIPIELPDPYFYHLDTCFSSLSTDVALMYLPAFTSEGSQKIKGHFKTVISIDESDAKQFVCNLVVYGNHLIINSGISESLEKTLADLGFEVHRVDMSEYIKGGGSVKCISLQLYGD
jgi:N-dimethylarginine dimethylaminohydrolase